MAYFAKKMPNIAILGSGLIGMFVGINLSNLNKVHFIGRSRSWKEKLDNATELTTSLSRGRQIGKCSRWNHILDLNHLGGGERIDFLLICVKRQHLATAIKQVQLALANNLIPSPKDGKTCIVTLMNGVDSVGEIKRLLGTFQNRFDYVEGIFSSNVIESQRGTVINWHLATSGYCYLSDSDHGQELDHLFNSGGIPTKCHSNMVGIQYGKLLMNLNNALCALSGLPLKQELLDARFRRLLGLSIFEALEMYQLEKIVPVSLTIIPFVLVPYIMLYMPTFLFSLLLPFILEVDDHATSSMYEDLKNGRDTEIEYLQGVIVDLAKGHSRQVPVCESILQKVRERQALKKGIIYTSADELFMRWFDLVL